MVPPIIDPPKSQLHSALQGNLASCKSFGGRRIISRLAGLGLYQHEIPERISLSWGTLFQQSDSQGEATCVFSIRISPFLPGNGITRFHSLRMVFKVSEPGVLEFEPGLSPAHSLHICLALRTL